MPIPQTKRVGTIPLKMKYRNMPGHSCESCKFRSAKWLVEYNPPGKNRVKHELCDTCAPNKP